MISHARQDGKISTGTCQIIQERLCPSSDAVDEFADEKATQALNRRLVRKMDAAFLSVMVLVFFFKRVDKPIIAWVAISGILLGPVKLTVHLAKRSLAVSNVISTYMARSLIRRYRWQPRGGHCLLCR